MHELEKPNRALESHVNEQRLRGTGDATLRLDVNMEALREQYDRELQPEEEAGEDKKTTQVRHLP